MKRKERPYRYAGTTTRVIAGAFCIVDGDFIVRAGMINGRHGEAEVWSAGEGVVWARPAQPGGVAPVHYG